MVHIHSKLGIRIVVEHTHVDSHLYRKVVEHKDLERVDLGHNHLEHKDLEHKDRIDCVEFGHEHLVDLVAAQLHPFVLESNLHIALDRLHDGMLLVALARLDGDALKVQHRLDHHDLFLVVLLLYPLEIQVRLYQVVHLLAP
ncbi:hypothetical protein MRB53_038823 [Persea americana]|nr:hypothetical protein MRB53_038823 [Persea americana]